MAPAETRDPSGEGAQRWDSERGSLVITQPAPGVMLFTYAGHVTADVVPFIRKATEPLIARNMKPDFFVDLEALTGYDPNYRYEITKWGDGIKGRVGVFMLLVRSRLIAMGVSVSNMMLGGMMTATNKRQDFQMALSAAIRKRSQAAPPPSP